MIRADRWTFKRLTRGNVLESTGEQGGIVDVRCAWSKSRVSAPESAEVTRPGAP